MPWILKDNEGMLWTTLCPQFGNLDEWIFERSNLQNSYKRLSK